MADVMEVIERKQQIREYYVTKHKFQFESELMKDINHGLLKTVLQFTVLSQVNVLSKTKLVTWGTRTGTGQVSGEKKDYCQKL